MCSVSCTWETQFWLQSGRKGLSAFPVQRLVLKGARGSTQLPTPVAGGGCKGVEQEAGLLVAALPISGSGIQVRLSRASPFGLPYQVAVQSPAPFFSCLRVKGDY